MTMANEPATRTSATEVRGPATDTFADRGPAPRETRPSFMTTEFWFALAGVAALIAAYNLADDETLDLFRTSLLATILGASYMVSRGLAKSGSRDPHGRRDL